MNDFREQISEDIRYYQEKHPYVENIGKDEWAFNFWILDKLFCEDEDEIENKIIDYSDHGIDCYVWHEETKDLYLIQNKYYSDQSKLTNEYFNSAVQDGYSQLLAGTYTRSEDLQKIFSSNLKNPDFYVYHYFYITNNVRSQAVDNSVQKFNERNSEKQRYAQIFYLDDIEEAYYGEPITPEQHLTIELETINKGTVLSVNNRAYGLSLPLDARYIMLPVKTLYDALNRAKDEGYPIFDANIREYLGKSKSVNKGIINTLKSESERNNFFFYNNGITIICTEASSRTVSGKLKVKFVDPQIVNGCQTVSSIQQVLSGMNQASLDEEFKNTFVMAKVLEIPKNTSASEDEFKMDELRKSIVKYNNSQNSIDEKTFEANNDLFKRIQLDFAKHGFLLLLKQSDRNKFSQQYKTATPLKEKAQSDLKLFGLDDAVTKTQEFFIPLEKLLQVVLAFKGDARQAFQKKGNLLKKGSTQYKIVTDAIRSPQFTTQRLLGLYLLYLRSEKAKSAKKEDGKVPVTWYLIEGLSKIECEGGQIEKVDDYLSNSEQIDQLIKVYKGATKMYLNDYIRKNEGKEYNSMIKEALDVEELRSCRDTVRSIL